MQAQTGVASAVNQVVDSFKENGTAIDGNTAAAVANQQALQSQKSAAESARERAATATGRRRPAWTRTSSRRRRSRTPSARKGR